MSRTKALSPTSSLSLSGEGPTTFVISGGGAGGSGGGIGGGGGGGGERLQRRRRGGEKKWLLSCHNNFYVGKDAVRRKAVLFPPYSESPN